MSAARQRFSPTPRTLARRVALWLAFAAAFLPSLIPGLHAGHGLPILMAPARHAAVEHAQNAVQLAANQSAAHHHHGLVHSGTMRPSAPSDDPTPASQRPDSGSCPICRTMQQMAAWTVPDSAFIVALVEIDVEPATFSAEQPTVPRSFSPSQPRAPPVAA